MCFAPYPAPWAVENQWKSGCRYLPVRPVFDSPSNEGCEAHLILYSQKHPLQQPGPVRCRRFADCGADIITVHVEACKDVAATLEAIRQLGVKPAITLNPDTPVSAIEPYLNQVDMVLVMSVVPGAGGQKFIPESLDKIRRIKKLLDENRLHADIEVDGGINTDNVRAALDAGANIIVAGSAVFKGDAAENVKKFKELM